MVSQVPDFVRCSTRDPKAENVDKAALLNELMPSRHDEYRPSESENSPQDLDKI
ncbi:hypothetical protein AZE42_14031 [Rhizopogon vesiculosus]|uniref:Uncharacterized protein n=1 Tax=Rhizopogon vesiculosus TaxID=180088 RepID=A0A1J8QF59_9AGAM|nr:hypothetical protein AZE42_14031 [Rhizopogon vesiculosus]